MSETLNAQDIAKKLQEQLTSLSATVDTHEVSTVDEVGDGIARVSGLKSAMAARYLARLIDSGRIRATAPPRSKNRAYRRT
mgnify:CR=1 FL=1